MAATALHTDGGRPACQPVCLCSALAAGPAPVTCAWPSTGNFLVATAVAMAAVVAAAAVTPFLVPLLVPFRLLLLPLLLCPRRFHVPLLLSLLLLFATATCCCCRRWRVTGAAQSSGCQ